MFVLISTDCKLFRTHLLEAHSTEVAKSFLHPNMSDEKYAWLLSCVDYNVACTDDEPSADASPVNDDANIEVLLFMSTL